LDSNEYAAPAFKKFKECQVINAEKADVFALGCSVSKLAEKKICLELSSPLKSLVARMTAEDPSQRISLDEALRGTRQLLETREKKKNKDQDASINLCNDLLIFS
jgi:hypothetical protein